MKKNLLQGICISLVVGALISITGCKKENKPVEDKKEQSEQSCIKGVYLTYGESDELYIFSDEEGKTLFLAEIPDDVVYDQEGNEKTRDILDYGDAVEVYYEGEVIESMPPKYMDVKKVVLKEKAGEIKKDEKKKYEEMISEIYQAPKDSEIPMMAVETQWQDGPSSARIAPYSYEWNYKDENGEEQYTISSPMEGQMVPQVPCENKSMSANLYFSKSPESITVEECTEDGEKKKKLEIESFNWGYVVNVKADKVYQVEGNWGDGRSVVFQFTPKQF